MDGKNFISPRSLYALIGTRASPTIVDVRRQPGFEADDRMLVSALRRAPERIAEWQADLPRDRAIVVYCVHGHEVSQQAAAALRVGGHDARYLEGGIAGWAELGLPLCKQAPTASSSWVTRERPKTG